MMIEQNKTIVRRYLEEGPRNPALTEESLAPDAVYYDPGAPPSIGIEGQQQRSAALLGAFPDTQFTVEDMIAEDDRIAVRWTFHATHTGNFRGIPPTGKSVTMTGITIYRLANEKIKEARSNLDMLGLLQQLGIIPT
jgi:steroid delta-isomerase-like uncharacterized protein